MSRPPGTKKPFLEDPDLYSIDEADFLESIDCEEGRALNFVAALSFGKQVEPDEAALKKHRSKRLKEGWTLNCFELPCTAAGKISTLRKKAARNIDDESINHRAIVAAARSIAFAGHAKLRRHEASTEASFKPEFLLGERIRLSILAQMADFDPMLQNYILLLRDKMVEEIRQVNNFSSDRPPQTFSDIPAEAAAEAKRKEKNARRMRQARAANGAKTRTENLSQEKPWKKVGMSRRAWYKNGKPNTA
jgi:hypothetical protein